MFAAPCCLRAELQCVKFYQVSINVHGDMKYFSRDDDLMEKGRSRNMNIFFKKRYSWSYNRETNIYINCI